jgi:hypothetical protein
MEDEPLLHKHLPEGLARIAQRFSGIFHTLPAMAASFSLTPSFSWVKGGSVPVETVSTVSTVCGKPLKRFFRERGLHTQLKQGVNERGSAPRSWVYEICGFNIKTGASLKPRLEGMTDKCLGSSLRDCSTLP